MRRAPIVLLTGEAGVGKTTIIQRVLDQISIRAGGFYTTEVREQGRRVGFEVVTLTGERGMLAHKDFKSRYWVGRYYVSIQDLNRVGVAAIETAMAEDDLVVVDEIGRMELFSKRFKGVVRQLLEGRKPVLGAIMSQRNPFADGIKQLPYVQVLNVTKLNRDHMVEEVQRRLEITPT